MWQKLYYLTHNGKPNKFLYFVRKFAGLLVPDAWYRMRLPALLREAERRSDYDYICRRVDYYNRIREPWTMTGEDRTKRTQGVCYYTGTLGGYRRGTFHTAYYFDQHDVTRYFPKRFRWNFFPGDVYFTPDVPAVVKSRLLTADNRNSVILKLDKLRHFMFVNDRKAFTEKRNRVIFRGKIRSSRVREAFLKAFFHHPLFDCGVVGRNEGCPDEWMQPCKTIREHLDYKFIMALEGNDVASNLKWVMSSNSIAVMTRPTCETWFMEGTLQAGVHYIEVKEDFSDLEEKIHYYIAHPDEAQTIIDNAHRHVEQFRAHPRRERLIQLLVMKRYFDTQKEK